MSDSFRVFINVEETFAIEYEDVNEAFHDLEKGEFLEAVYESATNFLTSYLGDSFGYFLLAEGQFLLKEFYVIGAESPETLKKEALEWNNSILFLVKTELDKLETARNNLGLKTIYRVIERKEKEDFENSIYSETNYYDLRKALEELDNLVHDGTWHVTIPKGGCGIGAKLSKDMCSDILENPDKYVILDVYYN